MKVVYRHYNSSDEFQNYFLGKWSGTGIHGFTDKNSDLDVKMRAQTDQKGIRLESALVRKRVPLWKRVFGKRHVPEILPSINISLSNLVFEPDLATFQGSDDRIKIQAMTEKSCHVLLEHKIAGRSSIQFSGVLSRR